ncbi:MAG: Ig-like domain-containing protein [Muribaculaceae bacterium]|nr:Ig-like domain-containing protein [Muribaculaceae bacterium]
MRKLFLTLFVIAATITGFAQTNLALQQPCIASSGEAALGNDGNSGSRWESAHGVDPQLWQVDLGETKMFNTIRILWEGAYAKTFEIYVGDEVGDDSFVVNSTKIYSIEEQALSNFPYLQVINLDIPANARYVMFKGIERGTPYGYSFYEFEIYNIDEEMVVTTLNISAELTNLVVGDNMPISVIAKDQMGAEMEPGTITWNSTDPSVGTVTDGVFTALAAGTTTITATVGEVTSNALVMSVAAEAMTPPTTNPTEPTDLDLNVIPVYSATYGKGLSESNPGWGVGGGAPNPLYTSIEEVAIVDGHQVVHVKGAGMNSRTKNSTNLSAEYNTVHVAVYPYSATQCKIFEDNEYGSALTYDGLVPGQWNYVEINDVNFSKNYICIELVGEYEFYLDHFYFAKPPVEDAVAPTLVKAELVKANAMSVELALQATDDLATNITYVITDQNNREYTATGANGAEINHTLTGLSPNTAYTFTVKAEDENGNFSDAMTVQATTNAFTAAPTPTTPEEDVMSIYSDAYTSSTPGLNFNNWGSATVFTGIEIEGNPTLQFVNMNYYGLEFNTQLDVTDMDYLHIDVFADAAGTLGIVPIWANPNGGNFAEIRSTITLTEGEWASFDIPMSAFDDPARNGSNLMFQIKLDNGNGNSLLIDNIYLYKEEGEEPPVDPDGTVLTADGHTITIYPYHYTGTDNYELIITSQETMSGLGGSFWHINGNETSDLRTNMTVSADGKTITITTTSTTEPQLYTPLYVMMPGEVNFGQITLNWIEKGGSEEEVTAITIEAEASELEVGKTLQLTVKDQNGNVVTNGLSFASSAESVATIDETGLVTAIAEGTATITATYVAPSRADGDAITAEFELTVTEASEPTEGQVLTADGHTITLVGYHYTGTDEYELIITSDETMVGLGGSFWHINGNEPTDIRNNMTISADGKTITITATSTEDPQLYTPLYVLMPGEVNFGMVTIEWIEIEDIPTAITDINAPVVAVKYINAMGQVSQRPFEGINIVVTSYADGTTSTNKIVK